MTQAPAIGLHIMSSKSPAKPPHGSQAGAATPHKPFFPKADKAAIRSHQNFLSHASTRDFTVADVAEMPEDACYWRFVEMRFGSRTQVACPDCQVNDKHYYRPDRRQWRCKHCHHTFSVTSGTVLHSRKLDFKRILLAVAWFVSGAKGVAALHTHRVLNVQAKTAFLLNQKIREAVSLIRELPPLRGVIELDGGHFGGRPRSGRVRRRPGKDKQVAAKILSQMAAQNAGKAMPKAKPSRENVERLKKRRIVFVMRQHSGLHGLGAVATRVFVLSAETAAQVRAPILSLVQSGSTVMSDENAAYSWVSKHFEHHVVNHQLEYSSATGINENQAEAFFSRLRRYVLGIGHKFEPKYVLDYAREMAWREDCRRQTEGTKTDALTRGLLRFHKSKWRGYFQGRIPNSDGDLVALG
jgi:transposase-like protein